jgi:predicted dienelactone hydrolase
MNRMARLLGACAAAMAPLAAGAAPVATSAAGINAVATAPSQPAIDSPELARLGEFAVGVRTLTLTERDAPDVIAPHAKRSIKVDLWYPATPRPGARPELYRATLQAEPPGAPVAFTMPGIAVRDAASIAGHFPLVIVSHGRSNATVALSWLTENLASKGYVVAAIRHEDALRSNPLEIPEMLLRRPLDIAFVAGSLQHSLASESLVDPQRTALVGYSMGGYGVLAAAGAALDPKGGAAQFVPDHQLAPYTQGGARAAELRVHDLKAVVAIAPVGGGAHDVWGKEGLAGISAPLLLIAGDHDLTVDYATGARTFLDAAACAERYLLTFKGAGHTLGFDPVPPGMRGNLWDISWFEDAVWRKERIIGINLHFITAFLDRYVKGDGTRAAYLDGLIEDSSAGQWQAPAGTAYGAYSPGGAGVTLWKGFQRGYAENLEFRQRSPRATSCAGSSP